MEESEEEFVSRSGNIRCYGSSNTHREKNTTKEDSVADNVSSSSSETSLVIDECWSQAEPNINKTDSELNIDSEQGVRITPCSEVQ